jgi:hypothetical protein
MAAMIEDGCGNSPQTDFTVLTSVKRMGLLGRPELVSIHLTFSHRVDVPRAGIHRRAETRRDSTQQRHTWRSMTRLEQIVFYRHYRKGTAEPFDLKGDPPLNIAPPQAQVPPAMPAESPLQIAMYVSPYDPHARTY